MSRRKGRILAFQSLYSWDVGGISIDDLLDFSWLEPENGSAESIKNDESCMFARLIVKGTLEHITEIDELIKQHLASNWSIDRLNKVALAVLRMSIYALLYQKDTHPSIIIDEAVDIAKEYGSDDSFKFINAILDKINKAVGLPQEG